jgi:tellurite resistance protein
MIVLVAAAEAGWLCCAIPLGLLVILGIVGHVESRGKGSLKAVTDTSLTLIGEAQRIEGAAVIRLFLRGRMVLPADGITVRSILMVDDITDGTSSPGRVLALDREHAGPDGAFVEVRETLVERAITDWQVFNVGYVAEPIIVCPQRGRRKLRATVLLASPRGALGSWSTEFTIDETSMGYLEASKRKTDAKLAVARFVLSVAACDGTIDPREGETIQRLFAERFNLKDDREARDQFKRVFRDAREALATRSVTPTNMLKQAAEGIRSDEELRELAFEFAVQIAAADGTIARVEQSMLELGGKALGMAESDQRRIIERYVRVDMYRLESKDSGAGSPETEEASLRRALQVPAELHGPALAAWLTAEYGRWNGRVGLPDVARRDEATRRLALIARLRSLIS